MSLTREQVETVCTVEGCQRKVLCRGVCNAHYRAMRRRGEFTRKRERHCSVDGCHRPHKGLGLCNMHYQRTRKTGSVGPAQPLLAPDGSSWSVGSYRMVSRPQHPLANKSGHVYVHRLVLFDRIGPGDHPCWNCGRLVSWHRTYPGHSLALVVDHIDRNADNNTPENLRPSCQSCNTRRPRK